MKNIVPVMKLMLLALVITAMINVDAIGTCNGLRGDSLKGAWLGELEIPNLALLRMGIIIPADSGNIQNGFLNIIDQATGNIPCEIVVRNDTVTAQIKNLGIEITGCFRNNQIIGEFRQGRAKFPVLFSRVEKLPVLSRPQEPKGPFPYSAEEVFFENKAAGIKLAGTLTIPEGKSGHNAVIMITGSGQQDRNEEIGKHKPFLVIADYLSRNGIIVLRYDDRGTGGSTGNFDNSTTGDFAGDALAAIAYLRGRKDVKSGHIGIIGHSEGGVAATIAAAGSPDVEFIVSLAGLMEDFEKIVLNQLLAQSGQIGKTPDEIELEKKWRKSIYEIAGSKTDSAEAAAKLWDIYKNLSDEDRIKLNWPEGRHAAQISQVLSPWWRYSLSIDNSEILKKVKCPVLALYGELDKQVNPEENMLFVKETIREGRMKNIEVKLLPGLNHLFQTAVTGSEYEYIRIDETISPVVLKLMADWIKRN